MAMSDKTLTRWRTRWRIICCSASLVPGISRRSMMAISITCSEAMVNKLYASIEINKWAVNSHVCVLASARPSGNITGSTTAIAAAGSTIACRPSSR